jgi:alpha-1,6-mannosyltransferase
MGLRREQSLLYAWCPLLLWEIAGAGHLDSVAIALITFALVARYRNRPIATGLFLGLAILTKMYPLVLLPALYRRGGAPWGAAWKMPATVAAVIALGYAAYSGVGRLVFGFLGGYAQEEGLTTGLRYFLLDWAERLPGLHHLSTALFFLVCTAIFAALTVWSWRSAAQPDSPPLGFLPPAFAFAAALMLLFSPHYAWYIAWLVPFFCLLPNLPTLVYLMGFFYGYTTALAEPGPRTFLLNQYLYAAVLAAILLHTGLRPLFAHWPIQRRLLQPEPPFAASDPL